MLSWKSRAFILIIAIACGAVTIATNASAAVTILYVSTNGNNSNPCTLAQPCRSLQRAITNTPVGGEVHILDSGFYGNNANIKKSMTIIGNGHTVSLGAPIIINEATAAVTLRRLELNGGGSTLNGIRVQGAKSVHIEGCVIRNFTEHGIFVTGAVEPYISILDSIVRNNGTTNVHGGFFVPTGSAARITVDRSRFEENTGDGIFLEGTEATISNSIASGNGANGIRFGLGLATVSSTVAANNSNGFSGIAATLGANVTVESSVLRGQGAGLNVIGNSTARVSNTTIVNNNIGIQNVASTLLSRGNNTVSGNTTNVAGNKTTLSAE